MTIIAAFSARIIGTLEDLAIIGISYKRGGATALEQYQQAYPADSSLNLEEYVIIATCNRWTLVTRSQNVARLRDRLSLASCEARPYAYQGEGALEHLSRIACSLESLNPGEDQIMGQVRQAFEAAQQRSTTGKLSHYAFEAALRIAKKVRREVELAPLNTSLFSLARPRLEQLFQRGAQVAVLGAGEMGTLAAMNLKGLPQLQLVIANRSVARATQLAEKVHGRAVSLADFLNDTEALAQLDALVCATPVAQLITPALREKMPKLRLIVDLGLPRNVHPSVAAAVETLDVDSLQEAGAARREQLLDNLAQADALVQAEVLQALDTWNEKQLGRSIYALRQTYLQTISRTLGDAVTPELAQTLAHRFAHIPTKGLRAVARDHGLAAAQTFLHEAGLSEGQPA